MKSRLLGAVCACVVTLFSSSPVWSATVWDLAADWSDVANANGVWTYREGSNALPSVPNLTTVASINHVAWARTNSVGSFLPFWARSQNDNPAGLDILTGDVFMHSTDPQNGGSNSYGNVIWTSPINGTVRISGGVWMGRDIGRTNLWGLSTTNSGLSEGYISSGDPYDRSNPFDFSNGSGGALVLENVAVSVGDVIQLSIYRIGGEGDFVGVNLTIEQTVVPIPAAAWLFGSGLLGLVGIARRKKSA